MGWKRKAKAHTSPVFGEMEDNIPSIRRAVITASTKGISVSTAIRRALINNRFTASASYLNRARSSYVHKLPTITQTSPVRDMGFFEPLAFPEGVPTILTTAYTVLSAMDQLDALKSAVPTYDISMHSYTLNGLITVYSEAVYTSDSVFSYVETILDEDDSVVSTTTKTAYRTVGEDTEAVRYTYLHLGLTKLKLYVPNEIDTHLFHDIFSTYAAAKDFVAYPIYPLMLDEVYIDSASRSQEYTDAKSLLNSISFPIEEVFASIKAGVPVNTGAKEHSISDIFLMNAVNINSTTQAGKSYLFEFFDNIYLNHVDPSTGSVNWVQSNYSVNISESDYNFKLNFNSITNTIESGVRTTYDSSIVAGNGSVTLYAPSAPGDTTHRKLVISAVTASTVVDYHSGLKTTLAIQLSNDPDSLDYANFCIPLIHGVVAQLPSLELKEQVFLESFVLISHSITEYYLKWYKQLWRDIKSIVVIAIAVLIAIYVRDGGVTAQAFLAAFATAIATNIVLQAILPMIDNPYLKAVVALAVSYAMGDFSGDSLSLADFTLADPMTLISITGAVGNAYLEQQMKDVQSATHDFIKDSSEMWEELQEKRDMLEDSEISELMLSSLMTSIRTYEEPDVFYARTLISNPGVLVYDQLESFYDSKLTLPRLNPMGQA